MLIWLNGAHGAGKTAVARRICRLRPGCRLLDPEQIGFKLRRTTPGAGPDDFKDIEQWRELTVAAVRAAVTETPLVVVPMTVWKADQFDATVGALRAFEVAIDHFTLLAAPQTLRWRLRWRLDWPSSRRWALGQVDQCAAALQSERFATHVWTDGRSIDAIADEILSLAERKTA